MSYVRVLGNKVNVGDMEFTKVRSKQISDACKMSTRFTVHTPEGEAKGEPGDYLMKGADPQDLYIVKGPRFAKLYDVAAEPKPIRDKVAEAYVMDVASEDQINEVLSDPSGTITGSQSPDCTVSIGTDEDNSNE